MLVCKWMAGMRAYSCKHFNSHLHAFTYKFVLSMGKNFYAASFE